MLASASPARLETLTRAGLSPRVVVSDVDEDAYTAPDAIALAGVLARAKADAVVAILDDETEMIPEPDEGSAPGASSGSATTTPGSAATLIVACDSLLELDGKPMGKPGTAAEAVQRWREMRGRTGHLHTGHHVVRRVGSTVRTASAVATTEVVFADLDDTEIEAYAATGEPERVAGAFTIDGLGGAYVTSISGDPHNVVGISLPLLRVLFADLGVAWHTLWAPR